MSDTPKRCSLDNDEIDQSGSYIRLHLMGGNVIRIRFFHDEDCLSRWLDKYTTDLKEAIDKL